MLFHVSEEPGIERFDPRLSEYTVEPVVWAIDAERLRNYLVPRECPRVTFYAGPQTTAVDKERFLGSNIAVVAVEEKRLVQIQNSRLYCYHLPPHTFECIDDCAGYFVSRGSVLPARVEVLADPVSELRRRGVELRALPNLWPLRDAVVASSLQFSIIRMRNALPRSADDRDIIVELSDARLEDRETIARLLNNYLRELANHRERALGATDAAVYPYWTSISLNRVAIRTVVRRQGDVVGFALIRGPESTGRAWEVAEFYVVPERRRGGIGGAALASIWRRFPGDWELQVHRRNADAVRFWLSCVKRWANREPEVEEVEAADGRRLQLRFSVDSAG